MQTVKINSNRKHKNIPLVIDLHGCVGCISSISEVKWNKKINALDHKCVLLINTNEVTTYTYNISSCATWSVVNCVLVGLSLYCKEW
jgi:hypothetical protein